MEAMERIDWVLKRALEIFRNENFALADRLERNGLTPVMLFKLVRCVAKAIAELCRENEHCGPIPMRVQLELDLFGPDTRTEGAGNQSEVDRAREAILVSGADPSGPAPVQNSSHSIDSNASTRARIEEGVLGV